MPETGEPISVAALYRFVRLPDYRRLRAPLLEQLELLGLRGTLLLAPEGINGTVAGAAEQLDALVAYLQTDTRFADLDVKRSTCARMPFRRARVRLKKEIVTLGVDGIDPNQSVGTYVDPAEWNRLIEDPDVIVIDTRNDYEVAVGTFRGAINPDTKSFREFPEFVDAELDIERDRKVAMFCTGGIRCEKATAYLKQRGFAEVYHLRGGILRYLEQIPANQSRWDGDCFVFDERVAVSHGLSEADHVMCFGCGWPVPPAAQQTAEYRPGVHCPNCVNQLSAEQRERFATRQQQFAARDDGAGAPSRHGSKVGVEECANH